MSLWGLQFPPKNEQKQVDLRFHSTKVEFVPLVFRGNIGLKKLFRLCLTFSPHLFPSLHFMCVFCFSTVTIHSQKMNDLWPAHFRLLMQKKKKKKIERKLGLTSSFLKIPFSVINRSLFVCSYCYFPPFIREFSEPL